MKNLTRVAVISGMLWMSLVSSAKAADRVVILPFENQSNRPAYNWLGEGFALMLSDLLSAGQIPVVSPEERRADLTWTADDGDGGL